MEARRGTYHRLNTATSQRVITGLAAVVLVGVFAWLIVRKVQPATGRMTHGFIAYYTAAWLLREGELGPQAYDDEWFSQQVQDILNQPIGEILTPSVPTMAWLALPLTGLSPQAARDTWIWFNLLLLAAGTALLLASLYQIQAHDLGPPLSTLHRRGITFLVILAALLSPAVAENFRIGQAFILFFALYSLSLYGLASGRNWLAGIALGLVFGLKSVGVFLWLCWLAQRRWSVLLWGVATILLIALLSLPWIDPDTWLAYGQSVIRFSRSPTLAVTAYQTTPGFFAHLFRADPVWNPTPLIHWPLLAAIPPAVVAILAIGVTVWLGRRAPAPLFFAALVPLSTILLPAAEEHHFVFLLLPAAVLLNDLLLHPPVGKWAWFDWLTLGAAVLSFMVPFPYEHPLLNPGWLALLAYPRLYGAWLIWIVAVHRMASTRNQPSVTSK